jgi:hypothetical protein
LAGDRDGRGRCHFDHSLCVWTFDWIV